MEPAGFTLGMAALLHLGRREDAEALLRLGVKKLGRNVHLLVSACHVALNARDFVEAEKRYAALRRAFPQESDGYTWGSDVATELGKADEAEALLEYAVDSELPGVSERWLQRYAQFARDRGDWHEADKRWSLLYLRYPHVIEGYLGRNEALRALGNDSEAARVMGTAIIMFPTDPRTQAAKSFDLHSNVGTKNQASNVTLAKVQQAIKPNSPGALQEVPAIPSDQSISPSEQPLADVKPDRAKTFHDAARAAESDKDWSTAEKAWRGFIEQHQGIWWAYAGLSNALKNQGLIDDAEKALQGAFSKCSDDPHIASAYAQLAEEKGDLAEASRRWDGLINRHPGDWLGYRGKAALLSRQGLVDDAEALLHHGAAQCPDNPDALHDIARLAERKEDWFGAEAAWRRFIEILPDFDWAHEGLAAALQAQGKHAGGGGVLRDTAQPKHVDHRSNVEKGPSPGHTADDDRSLLMMFESLGGRGHGCEFGIFQRHFGAEPLGLLRWADIDQDQLSEALETDFAGVGELAHTEIFVPENATPPEYWTKDKRFHMAMRSFVRADQVDLATFEKQVALRFLFLRRKLIDDLRDGQKIFVYKNMRRNLTAPELDRLHRAMRLYGDNTLLYIGYADTEHSPGTVVQLEKGLLIGYVDHFSHSADTDEYLGEANEGLMTICLSAAEMLGAGRS